MTTNCQIVVLKLSQNYSEYDGASPKITISMTFKCENDKPLSGSYEYDMDNCQYCNQNMSKESIEDSKMKARIINRNVEKYICPTTFHMDTYRFSYVLSQLHCYPTFCCRGNTVDKEKVYLFTVALYQPTQHYIDHKSNDITTMLMVEKRELEHSLNWLSTLGGAFSALGENSDSFAERAGKVSKGQLIIAVKLRDPQTMSRCRLYTAISFLQLGKLQTARKILEREWKYAKSLPPGTDPRLKRMCIGIWSKLQWNWKQQKGKENGMA